MAYVRSQGFLSGETALASSWTHFCRQTSLDASNHHLEFDIQRSSFSDSPDSTSFWIILEIRPGPLFLPSAICVAFFFHILQQMLPRGQVTCSPGISDLLIGALYNAAHNWIQQFQMFSSFWPAILETLDIDTLNLVRKDSIEVMLGSSDAFIVYIRIRNSSMNPSRPIYLQGNSSAPFSAKHVLQIPLAILVLASRASSIIYDLRRSRQISMKVATEQTMLQRDFTYIALITTLVIVLHYS